MPMANVNLVTAKDLNMELCMSFCSTKREILINFDKTFYAFLQHIDSFNASLHLFYALTGLIKKH
jgi:hypothetical protein